MVSRNELLAYIDDLLDVAAFSDYAPNGLQVEGRDHIGRLVTGVTACQALLDEAAARRADAVLVHHGYFWKGEDACIRGMKRARLKVLLENDINLLAYHLPLDAHPDMGNNARLAALLGIEVLGALGRDGGPSLALWGRFNKGISAEGLVTRIEQALNRTPLHIAGRVPSITTVGWCTGAAQGMIEHAAREGLDAYISGEISEPTVHTARELGIHYFAAGHHATERCGVQALGTHLAEHFGIEHEFVDVGNPV